MNYKIKPASVGKNNEHKQQKNSLKTLGNFPVEPFNLAATKLGEWA